MRPTDWLEAESLLIARLKAQCPGLADAFGAASLARMEEAHQITPAAHVLYAGETFGATRGGGGEAQQVIQTWMVVIAVRSSLDLISGEGARASAGVLISQVIAALAGHQLSPQYRPLRRVPSQPAGYSGEFAYFPTSWELTFIGG